MSCFEIIYLIFAFAGLVGLFIYVHKTWEIAKFTNKHNEIISHPAVTVKIIEDVNDYKHIRLRVKNHTALHANVKININYTLKQPGDSCTVMTGHSILEGAYGGNESWNISAYDDFEGHTSLQDLQDKTINPTDEITLNIITEVSAFDINNFKPNPIVQYKWKYKDKWVPYPVITKN